MDGYMNKELNNESVLHHQEPHNMVGKQTEYTQGKLNVRLHSISKGET